VTLTRGGFAKKPFSGGEGGRLWLLLFTGVEIRGKKGYSTQGGGKGYSMWLFGFPKGKRGESSSISLKGNIKGGGQGEMGKGEKGGPHRKRSHLLQRDVTREKKG